MNNEDEMNDKIKRKIKIQKRLYREVDNIRKELEKLKKKIQESSKKPLASPQNLPAEEPD